MNYNEIVEEIKTEAIKEFAIFLINKSEKDVIHVSDLPDLVQEMISKGGLPSNAIKLYR